MPTAPRLLLLAIALSSCGEPAPAAPPSMEGPAEPAMEPVGAPAPVDPQAEARARALTDWLSGCAVSDAFFVRHKLYTWTRADQVEGLRETPTLLSRERSAGGEPSLFDQALEGDEHPLARHLQRRGRRARRFAWVTPWATRMGWETGDYGDRLIEVTLREDVWTARFEPDGDPRWRVVDAEGDEVSEDRVRRTPERVGAVYHLGSGPRAFREVVLVDEDQIERWAVGTDALAARVVSDAENLRRLADRWTSEELSAPEPFGPWLRAGWPALPDTPTDVDRYRQCAALGSEAYEPTPAHLIAIAEALEAMPGQEPLEHTVRRRRRVVGGHPGSSHTFCDPTMGCYVIGPNGHAVPLSAVGPQ